ncbi:MAG: DUF4259 domain-containing protein [Pseudomonadota bacterium]
MGAWGADIFENDAAMDFLADYENSGVRALTEVFERVKTASNDGYIEVDEGSAALAAGEIIAKAYGKGSATLSNELGETIAIHASDVASHVSLPAAAVDAINLISADAETSEVFGLWLEAGAEDEWLDIVKGLKGRLEGLTR